LEQITQLYDNSASDTLFTVDAQPPGLTQGEAHTIVQKLSSSIDLHTLANIYHQQLKQKLKLEAIKIKFPMDSLTIGESTRSSNQKTMDLVSNHNTFATIEYFFSNVLTMRETIILREFHRYFKHPLANALEYYSLKQMALKDHLTSLGNRASYEEAAHRLISLSKRNQQSFGLLVIDMDNFKKVNDTFGHHEGDRVLMAMADVLTHSIRDTDFAFRFGGDEFCCLLADSDNRINSLIGKRIQQLMAKNQILCKHHISCSIGSTTYQQIDTEKCLFSRADKALYDAKESGRSCIRAA